MVLWTDLELECALSDDRLRQAWGAAFDVAPNAVAVIEDIVEANPWADPRIRIVLERHAQPGDFPLHVMVILGEPALDAKVADRDQELAVIRRICAELDCRALTSTENIDPYEWLLVTPAGQITVVDVEAEHLDDANAFVVSRVMAASGTTP